MNQVCKVGMLNFGEDTEIKVDDVLKLQTWSSTKGNSVKPIRKIDLDEAFAERRVYDLTVVGISPKRWHIELTIRRPNGRTEQCVYVVRRPDEKGNRKIRVWADLRRLIKFLSREYGVKQGDFQISEHFKDRG